MEFNKKKEYVINIEVTNKRDYFDKFLLFINPIIKVNQIDRNILSFFLVLINKYKDYPSDIIYKNIFSDNVKNIICSSLNITVKKYDSSIKRMENKGIIKNGKIIDGVVYPAFINTDEIRIRFN